MSNQLILLLLSFVLLGQPQELGLCHGALSSIASRCIVEERRALEEFKAGFLDPSGRLSSWEGLDCCSWHGVTCSYKTGHVIQLNLGDPHPDPLVCLFGSLSMRGRISPSLLALQHLARLDLSCNDFLESRVPPFIGSFKKLKYLNLSNTVFYRQVPGNLGNVSSPLDVEGSLGSKVEDCGWLSNLTSLRYLDMSSVDLGKAHHCLRALSVLPSLLEIHLSDCNIDYIPPSLPHMNFTSLYHLDLSDNFIHSAIPDWLFSLTSLRYIDLSGNQKLQGRIPNSIRNMTSLQVLGLSNIQGSFSEALGKLCRLQSLYLSWSDIDKYSTQLETLFSGCIKDSLQELHLQSTLLSSVPLWIGDLKRLRHLDLSNNYIKSVPDWLFSLRSLQHLDLRSNSLHGIIPASISNITSLMYLDLSYNLFREGPLPKTFGNLCKLQYLILSSCNISNRSDELENIFAGRCIRHSLRRLYLFNNSITGFMPNWIGELKNLEKLSLSSNLIYGSIPAWIGGLSSLRILILEANQLSGAVPESIGRLGELLVMLLANNSLEGAMSEAHFSNLAKLGVLSISNNKLTMEVSSDWVPPFRLWSLYASSCPIGPHFPTWIKTQDTLDKLYLSNTGISGSLPGWLWNLTLHLRYLDLSDNKISGLLPHLPLKFIQELDLSNNSFSGPAADVFSELMPNLEFLSVSINNLNDSIPSSFCELRNLHVLVLSKNQLSGEIPNCWKNSTSLLAVLDFSDNQISGEIPDTICSLPSLDSLHLRNNSLSGDLSSSLRICNGMAVLDLSYNKFTGNIPVWLGENLTSLRVFSLRSNMFTGNLPSALYHLAALQILDVAQNNLSGTIPRDFGNFNAMKFTNNIRREFDIHSGYYIQSIILNVKGRYVGYDRLLSLVSAIDLSDNFLSGSIPEELANLVGLQTLNLSGNYLTGMIMSKVGDMRELESLDLSRNKLSGAIPRSLSNLTFLGVLNLSYNNLSGKIPSGGQLNDLIEPSIYVGNYDLCGFPLPMCQSNKPETKAPVDEVRGKEKENEMVWAYLGMLQGFAVGFWAVWGVLLFIKKLRDAYFQFLDCISDRFYDSITNRTCKLKGPKSMLKNETRT